MLLRPAATRPIGCGAGDQLGHAFAIRSPQLISTDLHCAGAVRRPPGSADGAEPHRPPHPQRRQARSHSRRSQPPPRSCRSRRCPRTSPEAPARSVTRPARFRVRLPPHSPAKAFHSGHQPLHRTRHDAVRGDAKQPENCSGRRAEVWKRTQPSERVQRSKNAPWKLKPPRLRDEHQGGGLARHAGLLRAGSLQQTLMQRSAPDRIASHRIA